MRRVAITHVPKFCPKRAMRTVVGVCRTPASCHGPNASHTLRMHPRVPASREASLLSEALMEGLRLRGMSHSSFKSMLPTPPVLGQDHVSCGKLCAKFKQGWTEVSKTALVKIGLDGAALRFKPDLPWGGVFADAMHKVYTSHQSGACFMH